MKSIPNKCIAQGDSLARLVKTFILIIFSTLALLVVPSLQCTADENKPVYLEINNPEYNPGMFCTMGVVLGFLHHYEQGLFAGLEVNFRNKGLYFDPQKGPNWWEYYFEPIHIGNSSNITIQKQYGAETINYDMFIQKNLSRQQNYKLIKKYIIPRSHITRAVNSFIENNFNNHFVIGVHYRGTDKFSEAPPISYESARREIQIQLVRQRLRSSKKIKIFVASDEQAFINFMVASFPGIIIAQKINRSTNGSPLHFSAVDSPYNIGEAALLDCLILSKCDLLIRTASRLSLWSSYFNPYVQTIDLNKAYY